MEYLPSSLNDQLGDCGAITVQPSALEGQHHLQGPQPQLQPRPQQTEALTVMGAVHPVQFLQLMLAVAANQPLQVQEDTAAAVVHDDSNVDLEAQISGPVGAGPLSIQGQLGLHQDSLFSHTGLQISDPILRMRYLSIMNLVQGAMIGLTYLPGDLQGLHETYRRVLLITSVGAPIVVGATSFCVSFLFVSNPDRSMNWITGLSWLNGAMLAGPLAYWAIARRTGN